MSGLTAGLLSGLADGLLSGFADGLLPDGLEGFLSAGLMSGFAALSSLVDEAAGCPDGRPVDGRLTAGFDFLSC